MPMPNLQIGGGAAPVRSGGGMPMQPMGPKTGGRRGRGAPATGSSAPLLAHEVQPPQYANQPPPGMSQPQQPQGMHRGGAPARAGATPAVETKRYRANGPTVVDDQGREFPMSALGITVDVHIASMFVTVQGAWRVGRPSQHCMFRLPTTHKATVTSASVRIGQRIMRTAVISSADAEELGAKNQQKGPAHNEAGPPGAGDPSAYDPTCFRLPMPSVTPGEVVEVNVSYFEEIEYADGAFCVMVPLQLDGDSLGGRTQSELTELTCSVNSGGKNCQLRACSLPLRQMAAGPGVLRVTADSSQPWRPGSDFTLAYGISSASATASLLCDEASRSFTLVVSPPTADELRVQHGKAVVFLIDRSGSMHGEPMTQAKNALLLAVQMLTSNDFFNIVQYDHEQVYWRQVGPARS